MKKLFLLTIVACAMLACTKEDEGSGIPTPQIPFMNFVDSAGNNLFSINAIDTSEFIYDYNGGLMTWKDHENRRTRILTMQFSFSDEQQQFFNNMIEENPYLFIEETFGRLDESRTIIINGKEHYFRFAPYKGIFTQNDKALMYNTETIADFNFIFVHNIVLNEY